jgi:uncharacterized protein YkwD
MRYQDACLRLAVGTSLLALAGCAIDPSLLQAPGLTTTQVGTTGTPVGTTTSGGATTGTTTGTTTSGLAKGGGSVGTPVGATPAERALDLLNRYRRVAGVPPVTDDPATTKACMDHAAYLVKNKGNAALDGFGAHKEDPNLPGATPGWANLNLGNDVGFEEPVATIDGLMATLYHRTPMIGTDLEKVGFGYAGVPGSDNMADVLAFVTGDRPQEVVVFPADGQTDVPLAFGGEFPNPIPDGDVGGYPITLQMADSAKPTGMSASLKDDQGQDVPCHYSDHDHQASTAYSQGNTVCLIPKQLLEPGRSYQAHVQGTVDGQARNWDWRFSTPAVPAATDPLDKAAMGATIGKLAAIEGQVLGAGTLDDGTVYLNFSPDLDPSAFFPKDVWAKLGLGDPAKALEGKRVRLVCTPRRQTKGDVELDISDPRWFKLL